MIDNDPYLGQQISNYRLVKKLACGSFGCVYQAEHIWLKNRNVAIKLLSAPLASDKQRDRFLQEANVLSMLEHPHILHMLDAGIHNGFPYLITEYCSGGSLHDYIKGRSRHPLPIDEAITILTQIADGLQFVHEQKIVHRDLNPANILFNAKRKVLLADFGVAKMLHTVGIQQGTIIGTPPYMAPEQFRGLTSNKSDQYALACIAYELFTGQKPFTAPDMAALMFKHLTEQPLSPRQLNTQISQDIEQVILTSLAKDPHQRFASVQAFANALQQAAQAKNSPIENTPPANNQPSTSASTPLQIIHPIEAEPEQEDEDLNSSDYNYDQSQKILQAAQQQNEPENEEEMPAISQHLVTAIWTDHEIEDLDDDDDIRIDVLPLEEEHSLFEDKPIRVIPPVFEPPRLIPGSKPTRVLSTHPPTRTRATTSGPTDRQEGPSMVALPPATQRRAKPLSTPTTSRRPAIAATARSKQPPPRQVQRKPASRSQKKRPISWVTPVVIIVAFLLIGIITFIIPSADVTVVLATKSYSWPVVATASSTSKQDVTLHTVPLLTAHFTATVKKTGAASGTNTTVGTAPATGIVQFTNTGSSLVTIRQGIVVSTANHILFVTTAQAEVTSNGGIIVVPVEAQTPGANGNVAASAITVIPASSISQISQDSNGVAVKLSVTNPQSTTGGGGAGQQATIVTAKDVSTLQSSIDTQLQAKLQAWITQQERQQNSVLAIPVPQSQLSKGEVVTATPAAGAVAANGTFSETVSVDLPVQFVRKSDLQAQANAQYTQLSKETKPAKGLMKPPTEYTLVQGYPVQLTPARCSSSSKGSTVNVLTLCFTAHAPVALPISVQDVQSLVTGKQVQTVKQSLPNSENGLPGVKTVGVNVFPSFWPWLPFWSQRISVRFTAAT